MNANQLELLTYATMIECRRVANHQFKLHITNN